MLEAIVQKRVKKEEEKIQVEVEESLNELIELFRSHKLLSVFKLVLEEGRVGERRAREERKEFPRIFVHQNEVNVRECLELLYCYYSLIGKKRGMRIAELTRQVNKRYELYGEKLCSEEFSCFVINGFLQMHVIYEDEERTFGLVEEQKRIAELE